MQLILLGINHHHAQLALRERLALNQETGLSLLDALRRQVAEVVLISTCNRLEVYALSPEPQTARQAILTALCAQSGLPAAAWEEQTYTYYNKFAAAHLFEVAAGLDSMVLGENDILRQVKQALQLAHQAETCGPVLDQLFRFAIIAGKRVRTETALNEGCASMGALAARVLRQRLAAGSRVLILGAGRMARVLARNLAETDFQLTFVNRSPAAALALAAEHTGRVLPLPELGTALAGADAVVACTSAPGYLVRPQMLGDSRPRLLVDLGLPRNLDPALAKLPQLKLIDVDGLQASIDATYSQRHQAIGQAQTIIGEETARFLEWFHQRELVPTIRSLYGMFEEIRQRELTRGLAKYKDSLDAETEAIVERVTKAITQKILHYPVMQLKSAEAGRRQAYEQALSELFSLDEADGIGKYLALESRQQAPAFRS